MGIYCYIFIILTNLLLCAFSSASPAHPPAMTNLASSDVLFWFIYFKCGHCSRVCSWDLSNKFSQSKQPFQIEMNEILHFMWLFCQPIKSAISIWVVSFSYGQAVCPTLPWLLTAHKEKTAAQTKVYLKLLAFKNKITVNLFQPLMSRSKYYVS